MRSLSDPRWLAAPPSSSIIGLRGTLPGVSMHERRRTARGRRRHRRRIAARGLAAVSVVVLVTMVWFAIDVVLARNALEVTRSSLLQAQEAAAAGDLSRAQSRIESAASAAGRADRRTDGPLWAGLSRLPLVGADIRTVRDITSLVDTAAGTALEAAATTEGVMTAEGGLPDLTRDGRIDLEPIRLLATRLAQLDLEPLRAQASDLASSPDTPVLSAIEGARSEAVNAAETAVSLLERGRDAMGLVVSVLGNDEPRRYLVMVQNNAELRGTGGLIGFLAALDVQGGEIQLGEPEGVNPEAVLEGGDFVVRSRFLETAALDQPVDRPDDFAARYDAIAAGAFLASTNADPDLPTVAPVVLDLYEERAGQRLDGIIALDPIALQAIQMAVGPLELPEEVRNLSDDLPHPLLAEELARTLLIDVYDALGGPTDERRLYQNAVAEAALSGVLDGDWDAPAVADAIASSVAGRNLQIFLRDDDAQSAAQRLGAAGALEPRHAGDDLLAITGNNAAGNKMDVHVSHRTTADIALDEPRMVDGQVLLHRQVDSRIDVRNDIDVEGRDDYIVASYLPRPLGAPLTVDPRRGLARTWLTQWLPEDAEVLAVTDADGPIAYSADRIHGRRAVDHFLDVAADAQGAFAVSSIARVPVQWDGHTLTYSLTVWRQGKAIPDLLDLTVEGPQGWRIESAEFEGGGSPGGLGPAAPGSPLAVTIEDGAARLRGAATADTRLLVQLVPAPE
jgi:hypothetical protein